MNKKFSLKEQNLEQERIIQRALRTRGFLFPETVDEVEEYENRYGNTDFILPEELQESVFLQTINQESIIKESFVNNDLIAMAAREGKDIPDHIKAKMKKERDIARRKNNKK